MNIAELAERNFAFTFRRSDKVDKKFENKFSGFCIKMPVCELCDGETFESRDGLYYCDTCGTQSQDIREEMAEDTHAEVDPRLAMKKPKSKTASRGYERSSGKPWVMHEAYQIVIKKQLEFLIQIGVDAKIKDIVGQMWFKYLQITGIAFCGKTDDVLPSMGFMKKGSVFKHNAQVLGENARKKKKRKLKVEIDDDDDEFLELSSQISHEEWHLGEKSEHKREDEGESILSGIEEENQSDISLDEDDDDNDTDDEFVGSFALHDVTFARRMSLRTTLAFSYLGLLYMNEPIFLSDILRWVREGHFPFMEASTLLPDYMKFSNKDSILLSPRVLPVREQVLLDSASIAKMLWLKLPEQDLRKYTARFVMDLNLPAITHGFVNNLLKQYSPDKEFWVPKKTSSLNMLRFEEAAMAYIIIALKMCYGLDDSQHQVEAALAKKLEPLESRDSLPVWKDWVSATRQCQAKTQACGVPWSREELRQIRDPRTYTNFSKTHIYGSWANRDLEMIKGRTSILGPKKKGGRKEYRDSCSEMFSSLPEGSSTTDQPVSTPTNFPNTCRHGNASNDNETDGDCFKDCHERGIPLQDLKNLCISTESEGTEEVEREEGARSSSRKYIKYLCKDFNGDTLHPSLRFLVGVMAKRIEAKPEELEFVVMKLEDVLIKDVGKPRVVSKRR